MNNDTNQTEENVEVGAESVKVINDVTAPTEPSADVKEILPSTDVVDILPLETQPELAPATDAGETTTV
jgi:hypothetical protein